MSWKLGFIIVSLSLSKQLDGQVSWVKKHSPNENIHTMHVSPNNTVYVGTNNYGIFSSSNEGSTWQNISFGLPDSTIRVLQVASDNNVFVGTGSHGIFKYSSGTWTSVNSGLPSSNILVTSFAAAPSGVMYMMNTTGQIYKWDGNLWIEITNNFPSFGKHLFVGPNGILYAGAFTYGVYVFDNVNTWTRVGNQMPNSYVIKLTVSNSDTIYALCNSNNVLKCATSGGNWVSANGGLPPVNMNFIATDAQNNVFVAPSASSSSIYRSNNGGTTWTNVMNNIATSGVNSICFSPSGNTYIGASGVYKSINAWNAWTDVNIGLDAPRSIFCVEGINNGTLFSGTKIGVWRSTDDGTSWQLKNNGLNHLNVLQIMETSTGVLLLHAYNSIPRGAIYRSINNGDSWSLVAANGCDLYTKIVQHRADTLWATCRFNGATSLSYSINQGSTWINNPLMLSAIWDIDVTKDFTIFVGSETEGVSRSDNGGQTFMTGVGNTTSWYGNLLEIERDENGYIFAAGDWWNNILWYSTPSENGNNWTKFTDPDLIVHGVQDMVFDHFNNVYLACENGGIRMAANSNWSSTTDWILSSTGLLSANANILDLNFDTSGYMYAVAYTNSGLNGGLFKSINTINLSKSSVFTFVGDGLWSNSQNWLHQQKPPANISGNKMIIIDHVPQGNCILDEPLTLNSAVQLKIRPNRKLLMLD